MPYPEMYAIRQKFAREREEDVCGAVRREVRKALSQDGIRRGARIGIAAGSRGVKNIALILKTLVQELRQAGAEPFIFPAMGSHGGATAEGQARVLEHFGIAADTMDCPVLSSMAAIRIGESREGIPVFLDKHASEADHVVAVNRIKAHTEFKGEIESGIMKMLLIGMGKQEGARVYHKAFADFGFDRLVESLASVAIERSHILFALATVENAYDETALIRGLLPGEIVASERALLRRAKELAPRLPFDEIDILIVDEMGKNISGAGMDTNVIGRFYNIVAREPEKPKIKRIFARSLTPESMGNATGVGLADFIHRGLADRMDSRATATNCLTAGNPEKARVPIVCESDQEGVDFCLGTIGLTPPEEARLIRIRSTLHLTEVEISRALAGEVAGRADLELLAGPVPLEFDNQGRLGPMLSLAEGAVR